jgi:hypothetical protein
MKLPSAIGVALKLSSIELNSVHESPIVVGVEPPVISPDEPPVGSAEAVEAPRLTEVVVCVAPDDTAATADRINENF